MAMTKKGQKLYFLESPESESGLVFLAVEKISPYIWMGVDHECNVRSLCLRLRKTITAKPREGKHYVDIPEGEDFVTLAEAAVVASRRRDKIDPETQQEAGQGSSHSAATGTQGSEQHVNNIISMIISFYMTLSRYESYESTTTSL